MRKAQVQAISVVLISGIVIGLVGVAYMWGKPLIDKRSTITQFTSAVRFMEDLDKKIVDMAGTCSFEGACEESLNLPVPGIIELDQDGNSITYRFNVEQPLIIGGYVLFNTVNNASVASYGETPGVISLTGESSEGIYTLIFSVFYRELDTNDPPVPKGYKIKLLQSGKSTGNSRVIISYDGSQTQPEAAHNTGDLVLSKIKVQTV